MPEEKEDLKKAAELEGAAEIILKQPYQWVFLPHDEDGQVTCWIEEFPGCTAFGDNFEEARRELFEAAIAWLCVALEHGDGIPIPMGYRRTGYLPRRREEAAHP